MIRLSYEQTMKHFRQIKRLFRVFLYGWLVTWAGMTVGTASAHAELLRTDPSPGATITRQPTFLRLEFTEPAQPVPGGTFLVHEKHTYELLLTSTSDPTVLIAQLGIPFEPGTYQVVWTVEATDGHDLTGSYAFEYAPPNTMKRYGISLLVGIAIIVISSFVVIWRRSFTILRRDKKNP